MSRMLQQYRDAKALHPGMLVLFRNGEFYELFEEDAELGSRVLGLTLTKRDGTIPMAGVPVTRLEHYLGQLIKAGHRVAVCEQMEEPDPKKKIIHREVNRVVTPGTVIEDTLLDPKAPNHLVAVWCGKGGVFGVAWVDLSAGSFTAADVPAAKLADEFSRLNAAEVLFAEGQAGSVTEAAGVVLPRTRSARPDWTFDPSTAGQALRTHFQVSTLAGFGFDDDQPCLTAAGAVVIYLQETLRTSLAHLRRLQTHRPDSLLTLDEVTRRSLELTRTLRDAQRDGSLLSVLDRTVTPMGARMLHDSLLAPLTDLAAITARLDAVEELVKDHGLRGQLRDLLDACSDIQRLTTRVSTGRATPPDLAKIAATLRLLPALKAKLAGRRAALLVALEQRLELCPDLRDLLDRALKEDPPLSAKDGGVVRDGYSPELDELRKLSSEGKGWIARYQAQEITRTSIASLKVGYNEVHGYYIEVTHANAGRVPADYTRKQTLKNAERYITPQLKEYEEKVLSAQEKSQALELQLFTQLREQVGAQTHRLLNAADVLAAVDFLGALAELAASRNYVRPVLVNEPVLDIRDGRHPVLDVILPPGTFVPNDVAFGPEAGTFWLITGPNMSGKCVRGDTLVFTARGVLTMDELRPAAAPVGEFMPVDVGVCGRAGPARATHYFNAGECATVAVRTRFGFSLEGTPEHRIWVRLPDGTEGWRPLGEIRPGDRVAIERQIGLWGTSTGLTRPEVAHHFNTIAYQLPECLTTDLAYFMGMLVGDGTLTYRNHVTLSSGDEFLAAEFERIAGEVFGCPVTRKANGKDFTISSRCVREFLAVNGLGYDRAEGKRVPECVRRAPRAVVVAFLQGLFDTDGTAEKRYGNVRLNTASPRLAAEVQALLLNLGILAGVRVKATPRLPSHEVAVDGEDAIRFYELVGFRLARKQGRRALASALRRPNKGGVPHLETVLKAVQRRIATARDKTTPLKRAKAVHSLFYTYLPNGRNPSYAKLGELADYCAANRIDCAEVRSVLDTGYFYDEVRSVAPSRAAVYDLSVPNGESFVANGFVNHNSTFIRQVALLTLMAHVGSFVPAKAATVGLTDRIFTRVGASDELSRGQSTFMVEMTEAANILNNATPRSLVILDEIGRGTSTYDGVSLAWAITEYLHGAVGGRALFATHYHELAQLAATLPNLRNYNVTVQEHEKDVVFLHKIGPGNADKSYGIHVARLAGVPEAVLGRAEAVLGTLEARHQLPVGTPPPEVETRAAPPPPPTPAPPARAPRRKPAPEPVAPPEAPKRKPAPPSLFDDPDGPPF